MEGDSTSRLPKGERVGSYIIDRYLGEGITGIVYLVTRVGLGDKHFAMKLFKGGSGARDVADRFEAEVKKLSALDHPNIVKITDRGVAPDGQPYFVMEYIAGEALDDYCDTHDLSVHERLNLFEEVCGAVATVHEIENVHRDLKPSNILVRGGDDRPIPILIDFGLAKALHESQQAGAISWDEFRFSGTPNYMSPEQAGRGDGVTTIRSDTYSLGVILYELMIGAVPIQLREDEDTDQFRLRLWHEIPQRPSQWLRQQDFVEHICIAATRGGMRIAKLTRILKEDLDWIIMKAIEKEPDDRYKTVNDLRRDIKKYQRGDPIEVREGHKTYRRKKYARKHWKPLCGGAAVFVFLMALLIGVNELRKNERVQREGARSRELAALSREMRERDPELAILLAFEATNQSLTKEAISSLRWATVSSPLRKVLRGHESDTFAACFSTDGRRVVTASADGTARVWDAVTGQEISVLRGHGGNVVAASFCDDGQQVVTASSDKTARVWNAESGIQLAVLRGHEEAVQQASFSLDGRHIVTGSLDRTARLWHAESGAEIAVLRGHEGWIWTASFSLDSQRIVTASNDRTARLWDVVTGDEIAVLRGHRSEVKVAIFSPDGWTIATASSDGTARIWDGRTGSAGAVLKGHEGEVRAVAFSPDGRRVVTGGYDRVVRVWDVETSLEVAVLRGHEGWVCATSFDPEGRRVVTASSDGTARVWSAETGVETSVLRGHEGWIWSAAFSPDGESVLTASSDSTARLWLAGEEEEKKVLRRHEDYVLAAAFSRNGSRLVTASADRTARVWNTRNGEEVAVLRGHIGPVRTAAFSPNGRWVVTASSDRTARVWDAEKGSLLIEYREHEGAVNHASFSPNGRWVVTASSDRTARVWDAETGTPVSVLRGHARGVGSAAFSPNGRFVVTASSDGTARVWEADLGTEHARLEGHGGAVTVAGFGPSGHRILTASADETGRIWNVDTGTQLAVLGGHRGPITVASFDAEGLRAVTASSDGTARLWNVQTGANGAILRGHEGAVISASFAPDGSLVLTASADGSARVWDAETGVEVSALRGHKNQVNAVAISPDGRLIATASNDRTAILWGETWFASIEALVKIARARVSRTMTSKERDLYLLSGITTDDRGMSSNSRDDVRRMPVEVEIPPDEQRQGPFDGIHLVAYRGGKVTAHESGFRIETGDGPRNHSVESALLHTDTLEGKFDFEVELEVEEDQLWGSMGVYILSYQQMGQLLTDLSSEQKRRSVANLEFYENNDRYLRLRVNGRNGEMIVYDSHPGGYSLGIGTAGEKEPRHGLILLRVERTANQMLLEIRKSEKDSELLYRGVFELDDLQWGRDTLYICVGEVDNSQGCGKARVESIAVRDLEER
ncbi:MAG: protein kinase [Planctomycetota bacterium]|nr:protein kinase [Planctomycetota bacterium]